jgi:NAD-dependent dihydropyrimidine dehydrogenase PreA subunit
VTVTQEGGALAPAVHNPIEIDPVACIYCRICDDVCPGDIIYNRVDTKDLPDVRYPDECWYCGLCEQSCPTDAIRIVFPDHMLHCTTPVRSLLGFIEEDPESGAGDPAPPEADPGLLS